MFTCVLRHYAASTVLLTCSAQNFRTALAAKADRGAEKKKKKKKKEAGASLPWRNQLWQSLEVGCRKARLRVPLISKARTFRDSIIVAVSSKMPPLLITPYWPELVYYPLMQSRCRDEDFASVSPPGRRHCPGWCISYQRYYTTAVVSLLV